MIVLGLRVKTGWAAAVLLGGTPSKPVVLDSREIRLADWDQEHGRQPYHATFGTEQTDRALITRLVKDVERFSLRAIRQLLREYRTAGHRVRRAAIVVSSLTDPATIANQHMRAHASEGQLYRRVVEAALTRAAVTFRVTLSQHLHALLTHSLRRSVATIKRDLAELRHDTTRWRAEEKEAAAAAWLVRRRA